MARRQARVELRIHFLGLLIASALALLVARLWWLQVARGSFYAAKIGNSSEVTVRIPSVRGEIRDRNGLPLVQNRASYEIDFYLPEMVRDFRARTNEPPPMITYRGTEHGMPKDKREADIVRIVNQEVVPRLAELDLAKSYNAKRLAMHYRNNFEVPFTYIEDIDFETLAKFSEHDVGLGGVKIDVRPVRQYLYGALAAHLLGYVGMPNEPDREEVKKFDFYQPDIEGKSQVEQAMDSYLKGTPGVRVMQRNIKGKITGELRTEPPKPGNNVYLTIDARIQFIAERALRAVGRGAAVVVDPNTGDILAMASVPSYDPNVFIPSISLKDWKAINDDDTDPLTNRAIGSYAPGSTYKTVTGLAGLRKGLTQSSRFTCSGGVTYGNKFMACWVLQRHMAPHGTIDLTDALKYSCNAFFYQWGNAAGIQQIDAVGDALGLGQKTNVPLTGEDGGILPGPEWLRLNNPNERWSNGQTANVSIGQGAVQASPLQMAMVTATIANRGISYQPRLIDRVLDANGNPVTATEGKPPIVPPATVRADLHEAGISNEQIEMIRRGMWKVVNEPGGTGKRAQVKNVEVAGKTGTAQFWRGGVQDNHTWFICFAPYDKPKYAIAVFVQGAKSGGGVSAPIAQKILDESLALDRGYDPGLVKLEPAKGSFAFIEQVNYESAVPENMGAPAPAANADQETAEHTEMPPKPPGDSVKKSQVGVTPDIRPEADDQGRIIPRAKPVRRERRPNVFQKFFRSKEKEPARTAKPTPTPQKKRGPRWPF
jgi:penicillin-binding protein 2